MSSEKELGVSDKCKDSSLLLNNIYCMCTAKKKTFNKSVEEIIF